MVVAYNNIRVSNVLDHPVNINIGKERRRLKDHTDAAKNSASFFKDFDNVTKAIPVEHWQIQLILRSESVTRVYRKKA